MINTRFVNPIVIVVLTSIACLGPILTRAATISISSLKRDGSLAWTNAFTNGVCTVESATRVTGPWSSGKNYFTTSSVSRASVTLTSSNQFFRLIASDISATPQGFTNLVNSYGVLETIAGNGFGGTDGSNYWKVSYEGGFATNAALSRPHFAMADAAGNVFIVDKDSHSVLKVTRDGRIHTGFIHRDSKWPRTAA